MSDPSSHRPDENDAQGQDSAETEVSEQNAASADGIHLSGGEPQSELAGAKEEIAQHQEALLRLRAEMDNREKRAEREMIKARKFAIEQLLRDLIPVLDSFDQAIAQSGEGESEGLALTQKLFVKVLEDHGLETIDPGGQSFDPTWHEAIVAQPNAELAPDTVLDVLQKGYRLNDRLIRPARVIVSKAAE